MKLGLGTAQFGSAYGISNRRGQVPACEVAALMETAAAHGITVLDTAAAYGASEAVLGEVLGERHPFRIVTKSAPFDSPRVSSADIHLVRAALHRSLERLRAPCLDTWLVHHASALLRPGGERLAELFQESRSQGLVSKVGFSCYTTAELDAASRVLTPDVVQLPCSVIDQRFIQDGRLAALKAGGAEIHVRSIFLQGLLLLPVAQLPSQFSAYAGVFERVDRFAHTHGLTRLQVALGFVNRRGEIDVSLAGVTKVDELLQILSALDAAPDDLDFSSLACEFEALVNPARWPALQNLQSSGALS